MKDVVSIGERAEAPGSAASPSTTAHATAHATPQAVAGVVPGCGVIMAATGAQYLQMALNAAAGLRRHSAGLPTHLFTDQEEVSSDCFDRVIRLDRPWRRSKIDAMLATPFERTLYLDADVFVVADVREVFDLLDRFDMALAHDQERNSQHGAAIWRRPFGACFPQFNSGVIAFRRSPAVKALLQSWRAAVLEHDMSRDQPALRELLWESDLRIATLPPEFNMMELSAIMRLNGGSIAPRIIHHYRIHSPAAGATPGTVREMMGEAAAEALGRMIAADRFVAAAENRPPERLSRWRKRLLQLRMLLRAMLAGRRRRS